MNWRPSQAPPIPGLQLANRPKGLPGTISDMMSCEELNTEDRTIRQEPAGLHPRLLGANAKSKLDLFLRLQIQSEGSLIGGDDNIRVQKFFSKFLSSGPVISADSQFPFVNVSQSHQVISLLIKRT